MGAVLEDAPTRSEVKSQLRELDKRTDRLPPPRWPVISQLASRFDNTVFVDSGGAWGRYTPTTALGSADPLTPLQEEAALEPFPRKNKPPGTSR